MVRFGILLRLLQSRPTSGMLSRMVTKIFYSATVVSATGGLGERLYEGYDQAECLRLIDEAEASGKTVEWGSRVEKHDD